ncbi:MULTISPECIES: Lrp/AsnC family transcriptional regulator [Staphylococcus]|uniref:Lrp/AsnC family transcriptional regulator n=1 Tax=Staphylococcus TaxID=1279 RepID=UPI002DBA7BA7|nr:AsnC family transcriptional regulator [Staphylococcus auricularis]MEB6570522.1 AsnC family transcriptional regulator [Staphylococcus auricularis]
MDSTDKLLITLLKENSRLSYKQLSQKVHLSQPAVKERIEKLLDTNIISKFKMKQGTSKIKYQLLYILKQVSVSNYNRY